MLVPVILPGGAGARRPWGTYTLLEEGSGYKIKQIVIKPKASLSLRLHRHSYIPAGAKHRLANPGTADLVIIEVQAGRYVGEDDIVRFDDVYGRK